MFNVFGGIMKLLWVAVSGMADRCIIIMRMRWVLIGWS